MKKCAPCSNRWATPLIPPATSTSPGRRAILSRCLYTERGYDLPFKAVTLNMKTYIALARLFSEFRAQEQGG